MSFHFKALSRVDPFLISIKAICFSGTQLSSKLVKTIFSFFTVCSNNKLFKNGIYQIQV